MKPELFIRHYADYNGYYVYGRLPKVFLSVDGVLHPVFNYRTDIFETKAEASLAISKCVMGLEPEPIEYELTQDEMDEAYKYFEDKKS